MNTTASALIFAVVSVASAASIGMALADYAARPQTEVVKLERVVIEGRRVPAEVKSALHVEQLPRVVIEGRRTVASDVQVAAAAASARSL